MTPVRPAVITAIGIAISAAFAFAPTLARADEISDEEDVCRSAAIGKPCVDEGKPGTCQESTCGRIDYSGDKPKSIQAPCRRCVAGAAPPAKTEEPARSDAKTEPGKTDAAPKSACSVEPGPLSFATLPLGIALVAMTRRRGR